jgi:hypothetical protein
MTSRLPFSLRDAATLDAMSLLGVSESDLEALPFQHFLNKFPDSTTARRAHSSHAARRSALIMQIKCERSRARPNVSSARASPALLHAQVKLAKDERQLALRLQTDQMTLRRLAILQTREAMRGG